MIIDIEDNLFYKIKELMKNRSKSIYEELENITILKIIPNDTLQTARTVKTQRVKQSIKETIKSLYSEDMKVSKYQIHKRTGVAYVTLNKYYDDILEEFKR
ncbi:hypothetical protein ALC152_03390 [Arcobacter sp. 15-2]|uniref:hypothetical protein n=1 Tax=Arcobacter sp. 15-2 TaxID=3374109 RepID=UPI00399CDB5D